jgi:hypothetical protein
MKYFLSTTPGPMPPTPEQFDAAGAGSRERATRRFRLPSSGRRGWWFQRHERRFPSEVLDLMAGLPAVWASHLGDTPVLDFKDGIDTRAKPAEAQAAMARRLTRSSRLRPMDCESSRTASIELNLAR